MRKATDTTLRYLAMLQLIPETPDRISIAGIQRKLREQNREFEISKRSIQRDLEKLSLGFPINCDPDGRANHWFWPEKPALMQIPAMTNTTALALKLASEYLKPIMPPATLHLLDRYFQHADKVLKQGSLGGWAKKARIITRGPGLIPPRVAPDVQKAVYGALLENKQFEAGYKGKEQSDAMRVALSPLGIVFRDGIIYLVATSWDYTDPRHYALHRMRDARLLDTPANRLPGFGFAEYVKESFSYPVSDKKIKLRALFSEGAAAHLVESRLSDDQKITARKDGRMLVEATVADTAELRWWLLGFGSGVEIISPRSLRQEFSEMAEEMRNLYKPIAR